MSKSNHTHPLVIIGAGPGGYAAAFRAADLGMEVTLVDPRKNPGGVCLYEGCIPTKALLHAAMVKKQAMEARDIGFSFKEVTLEIEKLRKWKDQVVREMTDGLGGLARQRKVNYIRGTARFTASDTLEITRNNMKDPEKLTFGKAIIATGSRPVQLSGMEFSNDYIMSSRDALELKEIPGNLLVVGAGYIGLEMSSIYHSLGSNISLVELTPHFLPGADRDLVRIFEKGNRDLFHETFMESKVVGAKKSGKRVEVVIQTKEKEIRKKFDKILLAVGRAPVTDELGLENTKVETDQKKYIKVNARRRTNDDHIYAIGDVTGEPLLAHKATHEGIVAAEVIGGKDAVFDPRAIPAVIFTDPEIAWTGMAEEDAESAGFKTEVARFPWGASGRAKTIQTKNGLTKLLIDQATERILGVSIAGRHAGELIGEGTLAVEMAAVVSDMALTIHAHPTLSETLMEAAEAYSGQSIHMYKPKK